MWSPCPAHPDGRTTFADTDRPPSTMTDTQVDLVDDIVDAAAERGENMVTEQLVTLVERRDPMALESNSFGVSEDRLLAYAEALPSGENQVSPDDVRTALSERTVRSKSWVGGDTLYAVGDDHVSTYPLEWHEALGGENDVRRFVEVILAEVGDSEDAFDRGGSGVGIPENELLNAVTVLGTLSWDEAKQQLESLREEGVVTELADQQPDARVRLADVDHD